MRKKFVYFVLVPAVILSLLVYLFIDRVVESGLEFAGEKIASAKVEIDHLSVTLSPIGIRWQSMQVADRNDPWRNVFQTGNTQFALNSGQLLRGKYSIETMELNDFILGTKRSTDGSLPKLPEPVQSASAEPSFADKAQESLGKKVQQSSRVNLESFKAGINADSLVKAFDIQSLKKIDSLKSGTLTASKQWDASLADVETGKKRLAEVGENLKAINPSQIKGVDQVMSAIGTVDNAFKTVNDVSTQFNARKSSVESDLSGLSASFGSLDQAAMRDFERLMNMAHLPDLNTGAIARNLVGAEMYNRVITYLHYIDVARAMIKKHSPPAKDPDPPRMRGQNIQFPVERAYPKFWIQKILVSGGTDSLGQSDFIRARGEVLNITDDQSATHMPTTASLAGSQAGKRSMTFTALFDRTKDVPYDEYTGMRASLRTSGGRFPETILISGPA